MKLLYPCAAMLFLCMWMSQGGAARKSDFIGRAVQSVDKSKELSRRQLNEPSWWDVSKTVAGMISDEIPIVGSFIGGAISLFWPPGEKNVWDDVKAQTTAHMDAAFADGYAKFYKGVETNVRQISSLDDKLDMKSKRLHALDVDLVNHEPEMKARAKSDPYTSLLEFMPFANLRLVILKKLVVLEKGDEKVASRKLFVDALAKYIVYATKTAQKALTWRMSKRECTINKVYKGFKCSMEDKYTKEDFKPKNDYVKIDGCQGWCKHLQNDLKHAIVEKKLQKAVYDVIASWVKAYKIHLLELTGGSSYSCPVLARKHDYSGFTKVTKTGKKCGNWNYSDEERKILFPFDNGPIENYCRNPVDLENKKEPYCRVGDFQGVFEDCEAPKCAGFDNAYYNHIGEDKKK
jgi:flagellar hook-associated protein FlgK